jgi:hypothetical protein
MRGLLCCRHSQNATSYSGNGCWRVGFGQFPDIVFVLAKWEKEQSFREFEIVELKNTPFPEW